MFNDQILLTEICMDLESEDWRFRSISM